MEIVVALLIAWVVITVVGHLSWVIIRAIFRGIASIGQPPSLPARMPPANRTPVPKLVPPSQPVVDGDDYAVTRRMIQKLRLENRISASFESEALKHLRASEYGNASGLVSETGPKPDSTPTHADSETVEPVPAELVDVGLDGDQVSSGPVRPVGTGSPGDRPVQPVSTAVAVPALSASEIIQSFLSAHNIRWGELAAGMLIVGCSIGLVISRWSSLVQTHPVIPSLIFLGANAAIYAAGLYTLSRWRLRHTSRAVLVIATLLVPLSVLAGLAAAGTSADAVRLTDPITLAAILIVGSVYAGLLYLGGKALSRSTHAVPMVAAVAGPVMTLPLIPAAVRNFENNAGWLVAIGSASVFLALALMYRLRRANAASIGPSGGRVRLLVMVFGGFALSVSIAFAAYSLSLRGYEWTAMLPLAITAIPAVVALAGMSRSLMIHARSAGLSMAGAVSLCGLLGLSFIALPPSMVSASWLWTWALSLSLSGAAVGWVFRQPRWLAAATIPIGLAAVLTSKVWIAGQAWSTSEMWRRLFSGEAMIASLLLTLASGLIFWIVREPIRRRSMEYATVGWGGLTLAAAALLSVAPVSFLGVVPPWAVSSVLGVSVIASFVYSLRDHRAAHAASTATLFAWLSIVRPDQWFAIEAIRQWMFVATAVAATLLMMSELSRWLATRRAQQAQAIVDRASDIWIQLANAFAVVASVAAVLGVNDSPTASAVTLLVIVLLVLWASTIRGSIEMLRGSQVATAMFAGVIGYASFDQWLLGSEAWSRGSPLWGWAIAAGLVALFWLTIRELVRFLVDRTSDRPQEPATEQTITKGRAVGDRTQHLLGEASAPIVMPDGWMAVVATVLAGLGAAYFFGSLAILVSTSDMQLYEVSWGLPIAGLSTVGIVGWFMGRHETRGNMSVFVTAAVAITAIVWVACQLSTLLPLDPSGKLIGATTIATVSLVAAKLWLDLYRGGENQAVFRQASLVVTVLALGIASSALLQKGWFEPILDNQLADRSETIAVSIWWLASSLGLIWKTKQTPQPLAGVVSALLLAAAAAIVVPAFTNAGPVVGIQVAALASIGWIVIARWWGDQESRQLLQVTVDGASYMVLLLGAVTSLLVTVSIVLNLGALHVVFGPAGFMLSLSATIGLCSSRVREAFHGNLTSHWFLSWPVGVSLLAGQFGWLAYSMGWVAGVHVVEAVVAIWVSTAVGALWTYHRRSSGFDVAHIAGVGVATTAFAIEMGNRSVWMPWLSLTSLIAAGIQVALVAIETDSSRAKAILARFLGWFVGGGGLLLLVLRIADRSDGSVTWTMIPLWLSAWVVAWRWCSRESLIQSERRPQATLAIPDLEFASAALIAAILETAMYVVEGSEGRSSAWLRDPLLWTRVVAYLLVSGSAVWHACRGAVWTIAVGTLVATTSLVTVQLAIVMNATMTQRLTWCVLSSGFMVAFVAYWLPGLARALGRVTRVSPNRYFARLVQATWISSAVVALLGVYVAIQMMFLGAPAADIQLSIVTVALAAWAIAEMADESNLSKLRYAAVTVGLTAIGLWASVDAGATGHPVLAASMRWLVASVLVIPMMVFAIPKLIGKQAADRWRDALKKGTTVAAVTTVGSLGSMFAMEFALRDETGIEGVPLPIVIGVLVTLAVLSALAGAIAIASGPQSPWRERLNLRDSQRTMLIVAAQVIGVLAWLHLFLCQPDWTFTGMRAYWPYVVMLLAFVTVGITEWARRRGDVVMSRTLKQTALYLPLIPVLGFWLSGSFHKLNWAFHGGQVRYDVLLAIGTIYYLGIAALWKGVMPRVGAIVLGNAAWWVMLTQRPSWGFLSHPQLWMIPPAVCVLVVAHLYRDRLDPRVSSAIRYASMLVIYVSSTADMLIQQIGSTLSGPIILIMLALAGMLAGVVLRVRPFLYLGATFVFLGVTSMVWHAHQRFDSAWPWWVFGISTGLCLLVGLTALEKYKPQLRAYANRLASWEA